MMYISVLLIDARGAVRLTQQTVLPAALSSFRRAAPQGPRLYLLDSKTLYVQYYLSMSTQSSFHSSPLTNSNSSPVSYVENNETTSIPAPTPDVPFPDLHPSKPLPVLIRATDGKNKEKRDKKVKLSTVVEVDALEAFFVRYAEVCKGGMSGLKKRDRSKAKEKLKAKKKKAAAGEEGKKA